MSRIAFTVVGEGALVFAGNASPKVLLIDSLFETISVKRVTAHKNPMIRLWQRFKLQRELQLANPACAVYWCSLNKVTAYLCVSNLSLSDSDEIEINNYITQSKRLKLVCSQLLSIGNGLSPQYRQVLMVLNSPAGVRHVFLIDHKPVFSRLLPPSDGTVDYVEPIQATQQHLINRGMLEGEPIILCHGVTAVALLAIKENWAASTVSCLSNDASSLPSLAMQSYIAKRLYRFMTGQLPAYWFNGLKHYRHMNVSVLATSIVCALVLIVAAGMFSFNMKDWSVLLRTRASIISTNNNTQLLKAEAETYSSAPRVTAQRLQRLDLLRSMQPAGPDVLLATVSGVFEAHPDVTLNHISWFTIVADQEFQSQTQVAHRETLSINVATSDYLSVLLTGNIKARSLSKQQAIFTDFKATLMSMHGIGDLVEEQTPVTQWRMPDSAAVQQSELSVDSFTLRFSLSDVSS